MTIRFKYNREKPVYYSDFRTKIRDFCDPLTESQNNYIEQQRLSLKRTSIQIRLGRQQKTLARRERN